MYSPFSMLVYIYEVTTAFIGLSVRLYIVADNAVLAT